MNKVYSVALHIFRRDLRLDDNTALIEALKSSHHVIPCFILDERQIKNNPYKSDNGIQFMAQSLHELDESLKAKQSKLYLFYGNAEEVVAELLSKIKIQAVFVNRDYTPFSRERDKKIEIICRNVGIDFHSYADALLHEPEEVLKTNDQPYTVFTHFFKKASLLHVKKPNSNVYQNYCRDSISFENTDILKQLLKNHNSNLYVNGGREEALTLLTQIKKLGRYEEIRNIPSMQGTTKLSAHNKFGTLSIRELYAEIVNNFGKNHSLIKELYWRDFFTHIAFHYPDVFEGPFHKKYSNIVWSKNEKHFQAWCKGQTGFPIVDAGMRQLNETGYMHNRVRMITASFLVKDLHIDWRWGEKYFAQKLVDYDPAVNNGNWQWVASTGCDAQPYFRIFNPWLQQKKFDPDGLYVRQWIPELETSHYPAPLVDHAIESQKTKMIYKAGLE